MSAGRSPRFWPTGADALRREDPIVPPPAPALTAPALTGPALTAARNGRVDARAYSAAAAMNRMPTPWRPPAPRAAAEPFSGRHVATDPITGEVLPPHPFPSPRQRDGDGTA
jgi:hypothetical protein